MDGGLREYLAKCETEPLDVRVLERYAAEMAEAIPKIVDDIEERELLAAELRLLPPATSRSKKERA